MAGVAGSERIALRASAADRRATAAAGVTAKLWYVKSIGVAPVQLPGLAVSVAPCDAEPEIDGGVACAGPLAAVTTTVCFDTAVLTPALLVAGTSTRMLPPTSADASV